MGGGVIHAPYLLLNFAVNKNCSKKKKKKKTLRECRIRTLFRKGGLGVSEKSIIFRALLLADLYVFKKQWLGMDRDLGSVRSW